MIKGRPADRCEFLRVSRAVGIRLGRGVEAGCVVLGSSGGVIGGCGVGGRSGQWREYGRRRSRHKRVGKGSGGKDVVGVDGGGCGVFLDGREDGRNVWVGWIFAEEGHLLREIEIEGAPEVVARLSKPGVWTTHHRPFWGDEVKEGGNVVLFLVRTICAHG